MIKVKLCFLFIFFYMLAHEVWEYSCFFGIAKLMINGSISSLDIKTPQQKINKKIVLSAICSFERDESSHRLLMKITIKKKKKPRVE